MSQRILIVDDDISLTSSLASLLADAGFTVETAYTAEDGLLLARTVKPDLALLDVMVPVFGGLELCRRIRSFSDMPIIFLTALGGVNQIVEGLELGADDYIVKPFRSLELLARVKAHLRRMSEGDRRDQELVFGDREIIIDQFTRRILVRGVVVELTPREYDLLVTLAQTPGRVCTTSELMRRAWGINEPDGSDNIKPYIHYLRKKLEVDPAAPRWILTVRGVGYRFADA
jgi:DNA-binding response OmpR family regulator